MLQLLILSGFSFVGVIAAVEYLQFERLFKTKYPEMYRGARESITFDGFGPVGFWHEALYIKRHSRVESDNLPLIRRLRRVKTLVSTLVVLILLFFLSLFV